MRIGHGWDLHRLVDDRPFRLGGLTLPHDKGPAGHSDGDVLLHAVTDALLGAAALGDIGAHFPDSDPRWKGADSADLLAHVMAKIQSVGLRVGNADVTVVAEAPKIGPYRDALRQRLAQLLEVHPSRVSVKAKTAEGLGDIGRGEAVACHAVVLLDEAQPD
ncbi:MAG: 2-C-methyl-D-erythritol 2,4-cyclodiphosphate synthase [Acidobacteriota bacterium]